MNGEVPFANEPGENRAPLHKRCVHMSREKHINTPREGICKISTFSNGCNT